VAATADVAAAGALLTALLACATDIRTRRIPNRLTLAAVCLALLWRVATGGVAAGAAGLAGCVLGLLLFLPLFIVRGLGGGDVKLLAALGAWVGAFLVTWTALYAALAGGLLALTLALWHGVMRRTISNVWLLLAHWRVAGMGPVAGLTLGDSRSLRMAYALPITCGLVVALWLKG
jgi:prepilin peptidase CpaA